jgi:carbamoyl-phosphate synthase/aspartate carbamoyltransferase
MVGYPESLTDPSYEGQILVLTYPLVGSYGVPKRDPSGFKSASLPAYFESSRIHIAGLIVGSYSGAGKDFSHHLADSELGQWLAEEGVPAIYGVDTRAITKMIREKGSLLCKMLAEKALGSSAESSSNGIVDALQSGAKKLLGSVRSPSPSSWKSDYQDIAFDDPNVKNLVAKVSLPEAKVYSPKTFSSSPTPPKELLHPSGRPLRVLAVDVGMKFNQVSSSRWFRGTTTFLLRRKSPSMVFSSQTVPVIQSPCLLRSNASRRQCSLPNSRSLVSV